MSTPISTSAPGSSSRPVSPVTSAAVVLAVVVSGFALVDAVASGAGRASLLDAGWPGSVLWVGVALAHALCYLAIVAVLLTVARAELAGSGWLGVLRWLLVGTYGAMAVGISLSAWVSQPAGVVGVVVNLGFVLMLVVPGVLGVTLLVRGSRSPSAWLLAACGPVLVAVLAMAALAPGWAHPAYVETCANLGLALLGSGAGAAGATRTTRGRERLTASSGS
jgi:hypothetical protein